jgi:nucleotide-binding universal stress UspA family protein
MTEQLAIAIWILSGCWIERNYAPLRRSDLRTYAISGLLGPLWGLANKGRRESHAATERYAELERATPGEASEGPACVLAGYDGTPGSWSALEWAARRAAERKQTLRIVHSYSVRPPPSDSAGGYLRAHERAEQDAALKVAQASARIRSVYPGLEIEEVAAAGPPADVLIRHGSGASLMVLATRPSTRARQLIKRSVTNAVTGRAPCPVVSLPAAA